MKVAKEWQWQCWLVHRNPGSEPKLQAHSPGRMGSKSISSLSECRTRFERRAEVLTSLAMTMRCRALNACTLRERCVSIIFITLTNSIKYAYKVMLESSSLRLWKRRQGRIGEGGRSSCKQMWMVNSGMPNASVGAFFLWSKNFERCIMCCMCQTVPEIRPKTEVALLNLWQFWVGLSHWIEMV